jgi:hypothetical protein
MKARRSHRGATLSAQFPVGKASLREGKIIALGFTKTTGNAKHRYTKATNAVARRINALKERMTVLPATPTSAAEVSLAAEIRVAIRAKPEPERFAFDHRSDAKVVRAILSGPAFLSGLTPEAIHRIRDAALQALHPKEVEEIAELEAAEKIARQAVKHAQERIAKRADLRQDSDGAWRHMSEPSPRVSETAAIPSDGDMDSAARR